MSINSIIHTHQVYEGLPGGDRQVCPGTQTDSYGNAEVIASELNTSKGVSTHSATHIILIDDASGEADKAINWKERINNGENFALTEVVWDTSTEAGGWIEVPVTA